MASRFAASGPTGAPEAMREAETIRMTFDRGRLAATSDEAVVQFVGWSEGRFVFHPGATAEGVPSPSRRTS